MPPIVNVKSQDSLVKTVREIRAQRVLAQFKNLPDARLLCFFDDVDCQLLKGRIGAANRGFSEPLSEPLDTHTLWSYYPDYLKDLIFVDNPSSLLWERVFDHVIYLHGSTCTNEIGLAITFAHELQHFIQHIAARTLWAQNRLIPDLPNYVITNLNLNWFDIPIEREARIVSIQIAERLFGAERVKAFMDQRVTEAINAVDLADCEFVRGLVGSVPACYDLEGQTAEMFERLEPYKAEFMKLLEERKESPYFAGLNIATLFKTAEAHFGVSLQDDKKAVPQRGSS